MNWCCYIYVFSTKWLLLVVANESFCYLNKRLQPDPPLRWPANQFFQPKARPKLEPHAKPGRLLPTEKVSETKQLKVWPPVPPTPEHGCAEYGNSWRSKWKRSNHFRQPSPEWWLARQKCRRSASPAGSRLARTSLGSRPRGDRYHLKQAMRGQPTSKLQPKNGTNNKRTPYSINWDTKSVVDVQVACLCLASKFGQNPICFFKLIILMKQIERASSIVV